MTLTARHAGIAPETGDVAGHIETRGIDYIPDDERHGRPRALFGIWEDPGAHAYPAHQDESIALRGEPVRSGR